MDGARLTAYPVSMYPNPSPEPGPDIIVVVEAGGANEPAATGDENEAAEELEEDARAPRSGCTGGIRAASCRRSFTSRRRSALLACSTENLACGEA